MLASGLLDLRFRLGKEVIVEGVESIEPHRFLEDEGNLVAQGFVYGRACPLNTWTGTTHGVAWFGLQTFKQGSKAGAREELAPAATAASAGAVED